MQRHNLHQACALLGGIVRRGSRYRSNATAEKQREKDAENKEARLHVHDRIAKKRVALEHAQESIQSQTHKLL